MNPKKVLFIVLVGIGVVVLLYLQPWVSEERKIHELVDAMLTELEIRTPEHPLERAAKARNISQQFFDPLTVSVQIEGEELREFHSRKEIEQSILGIRSQLSSLELAVVSRQIRISGPRAELRGQAKILGAMPGAEGKFLEQPSIHLEFEKHERQWLIRSGAVMPEDSEGYDDFD